MTQIIYKATTASTVAAGGTITTGFVHLLPQWAPPIEYIGTTDPWHALFLCGTTMTVAGGCNTGKILTAKVRCYGRRTTLYAGRECFGTDCEITQQYGSQTGAAAPGRPSIMYVLTYRAVGELTRP
ncbi:hypothetical protein E4H12_09515 [Candidatus Thorarchaeota archaeon]|nr:MAG: hypothetical protein E4H12_09515 [Candidatus Thorarchaeota archaeon]